MSNYTKSTNFATKDNLTPGDPLKIVRGTEIDTEFNNIATAIATKTDNASAAITGGSITGITDLAIADGGTGASTATAAINNLLPSQTSNANKYLQTDGTNVSWDAVSLSTSDITGTLPVANGGTGVTSSTGTGSVVLSNSPTLVTPALGTPASGVATNLTGLPISTGVSGLGTGVATFLGTPSSANLASAVTDETGSGALVFANSPTLVTPALGTPSSATLTNATGLPISTGVSGLGTGVATFLATPSSANLASAVSDETGSGALVFANSPTLVTPALGTPSSGTLTNATGLPISTGVSGLGTGVATALAVNVGSAGAPVVNGGALGTPSSGTVTNLTGTASININGTVGATTANTGAFTTLSASSSVTLSGGTANGVTYLNGSKVLTSGSALTFDGTQLNAVGAVIGVSTPLRISNSSATTNGRGAGLEFYGSSNTFGRIEGFWAGSDEQVRLFSTGSMTFSTAGTEGMRLTSTSLYTASGINVGIGTSSPSTKLDVVGAIRSSVASGNSAININNSSLTGKSWDLFPNTASGESDLLWYYGGTSAGTRMTLSNAGNLGLGVTPSAWSTSYGIKGFNISNGAVYGATNDMNVLFNSYFNGTNFIYSTTAVATKYTQGPSGQHQWFTAPSGTAGDAISFTQAMTLDASGNLGVGTTSPQLARAHFTTASTYTLNLQNDASNQSGIIFSRNGNGAASSTAIVGNGESTGYLYFLTGGSERARIDSSGNLLIDGDATPSAGAGAYVALRGGDNTCIQTRRAGTANREQISFFNGNGQIGSISTSGTTTSYNTTSDQRLKENIVDAPEFGSVIDSIKVRSYDWKADGNHQRAGFVAQELVTVAPEAVHQPADSEEMMAVDYSKLVPMLVKEIQSLRQRLAVLEAK